MEKFCYFVPFKAFTCIPICSRSGQGLDGWVMGVGPGLLLVRLCPSQSMGLLLLSVVGFALEYVCLGVLTGLWRHSFEATDDLHVGALMETRVADLAKAVGCQPAEVMDLRDIPNTPVPHATTPSCPLGVSIVVGFPCHGNPGRPTTHFKDSAFPSGCQGACFCFPQVLRVCFFDAASLGATTGLVTSFAEAVLNGVCGATGLGLTLVSETPSGKGRTGKATPTKESKKPGEDSGAGDAGAPSGGAAGAGSSGAASGALPAAPSEFHHYADRPSFFSGLVRNFTFRVLGLRLTGAEGEEIWGIKEFCVRCMGHGAIDHTSLWGGRPAIKLFPHRGAIRALLVQDYQKFLKLASSVDGRYGEPVNFRVKGRPCIRVLFRVMVRVGRAIFSTPAPMCRRDLGNMRHRRPTEPAQHSLRAHTSQPPHS